MTEVERNVQRKLRTRAKEKRSRGRNVKVGYQKLTIDSEVWKWSKKTAEIQKIDKSKWTGAE